ncbi:MAG: 3-deoxy-7-phosphoheptulonate synthase [Deltaproteobacteria bacterium]|nr:3-deoxy-7-phosphoheptulonate synthase [Deltaproteobacteria bacterium]
MIIIMKRDSTQEDVDRIRKKVEQMGFKTHVSVGKEKVIIGIIGETRAKNELLTAFSSEKGVEAVHPISKPYKLTSKEGKENTTIEVDGAKFGDGSFTVIAGPCAVENEEQIIETARGVKKCGGKLLRGGAFKPRTSPYSFQGLGKRGLELLKMAKEETGLPIVTEVLNPKDLDTVLEYADVLQIGARNMQNFVLLKLVGQVDKPVLLKRGMASTITELLMSAEYILAGGNSEVILCERGIRTFETATRFTLDISAIPVLKKETHLPVIIDPSHAAGKKAYVPALAKAAVAAGADGLIVEVHYKPETALSDAAQQLSIEEFCDLMNELKAIAHTAGKKMN